jgi:hypothetical protein
MAGLKGKSGPPGNMNAFKHGLAASQKWREVGIPTEHEESALNPFITQCSPIFNPACVLMSRNRFEIGKGNSQRVFDSFNDLNGWNGLNKGTSLSYVCLRSRR